MAVYVHNSHTSVMGMLCMSCDILVYVWMIAIFYVSNSNDSCYVKMIYSKD